MNQIEQLKQWIAGSDNIVFFGGGCPRRAGYRISEAWTACITRNMIIRRKRY